MPVQQGLACHSAGRTSKDYEGYRTKYAIVIRLSELLEKGIFKWQRTTIRVRVNIRIRVPRNPFHTTKEKVRKVNVALRQAQAARRMGEVGKARVNLALPI
jgi:hypothetical protein